MKVLELIRELKDFNRLYGDRDVVFLEPETNKEIEFDSVTYDGVRIMLA